MAVYIGALIALFLVLMALALCKDRPILMLKKRSEKTGFLQRHKDSLEKLVIAVMAAAVGAWVKSLFDKP
jgi:hypothetical protein